MNNRRLTVLHVSICIARANNNNACWLCQHGRVPFYSSMHCKVHQWASYWLNNNVNSLGCTNYKFTYCQTYAYHGHTGFVDIPFNARSIC